jgi:hypothetical protein
MMQTYQPEVEESLGVPGAGRWLLLIHQIPPKPNYLRVKIWRRLQALGAVAIKNSVYALPRNDQTLEDFQWLQKEVEQSGGEASICEARFVDGLSDEQIEALFNAARDGEYAALAEEIRGLSESLPPGDLPDLQRRELKGHVQRFKKRLGQIVALDFFHTEGRGGAEGLLSALEVRLRPAMVTDEAQLSSLAVESYQGRVWVTRRGVHVDRMASAWLIRRFIDPEARFRFVVDRAYKPDADELRFDMFDAEFTHEGELCTFEVLVARFGLENRALTSIAEIVHDIDLKDAKFKREETSGIAAAIAGIAMGTRDDDARLVQSAVLFDALHTLMRSKRR